ncbi:MAG: carbohydrate ABC transporter permease [Spirochaetes bacterium]|nr:carbohydrate ABC transporter permease [Spirochaetota bacterium]MBU0954352.1 carbohydrate ABC transporter permease [Spirochaetota bacterium]
MSMMSRQQTLFSPRRKLRLEPFSIVNTAFLLLLISIIVIPILKVLVDSFDGMASETVFSLFPRRLTLDGYRHVITRSTIIRPFFVSIGMTLAGLLVSMTVTSLYAYALAQPKLPGKKIFIAMAMITMVFQPGLVPLFIVVRNLGIMNTLLPVILIKAIDAYYMFLMMNFFKTIPASITEAAKIDGCTPWQVFWRIILPLSKPGLAAISLFYMVLFWNQWFEYVIYLPKATDLHNFQVFMRSILIESETQGYDGFVVASQALKNAIVVISIIPVMIVYPFVQKHFVKGINLGAIKG